MTGTDSLFSKYSTLRPTICDRPQLQKVCALVLHITHVHVHVCTHFVQYMYLAGVNGVVELSGKHLGQGDSHTEGHDGDDECVL